MLLLGVGLFMFVMAVRMVKSALEENADYRRVRRDGVQLQAEIVDYDRRPGQNAGDVYLRPIVRYHLNDRRYECTVGNVGGSATPPMGTFITVVVSPKTPYDAYDPYVGTARVVWFALGSLLVSCGFVAWGVARF